MLFINALSNAGAAANYFRAHLERSDYYLRDKQETVPSIWEGRGAAALGIAGKEVDRESFERLMHGLHPVTGERLSSRTKSDGRPAYDMTMDSPKITTVAHQVGGDNRIPDVQRAARQ